MEKRIIEGIEACRPGSDDLHSPELSDVACQVQQDPEARPLRARAKVGCVDFVLDRSSLRATRFGRADFGSAALGGRGVGHPRRPSCGQASRRSADARRRRSMVARQGPRLRWSRRQWLAGFASIAATLLIAAFLSSWLALRHRCAVGGDCPRVVRRAGSRLAGYRARPPANSRCLPRCWHHLPPGNGSAATRPAAEWLIDCKISTGARPCYSSCECRGPDYPPLHRSIRNRTPRARPSATGKADNRVLRARGAGGRTQLSHVCQLLAPAVGLVFPKPSAFMASSSVARATGTTRKII